MSPDTDDESAKDVEHDMADDADRMQERVDELGDHVDEAAKKAEGTRAHADPDADGPLGEVAADWDDTKSDEDDPSGAVDDS